MPPSPQSEFDRLRSIMAQLRDPETGCPWDIEQDFASIAPYTIEEAYEVADAIERQDFPDLRDELGDLLLQVVFHSQMAAEASHFDIEDVARSINDKMIRRHPHVFEADDGRDANGQTEAWETIKARERAEKKDKNDTPVSAMDGVAKALPALMRAEKLQKRAARTGFDWTEPRDILEKLDEETREVTEAIDSGDLEHIEEEIGDLLFVAANLARRFKIDPEIALRGANAKFERRFRSMERLAESRGQSFSGLNLDEQDKLWRDVKAGK
ncbi:nucleoside triphosphate pyrophosphohydrolase [Henriciella sp.]|uniref:nucleoside triphosphate pyrophosphohydrolase n=1 Tax=Henriciella sp. TaxID=1968823 RepID=UPI00260FF04C|nr:nucleoside triphosphate pyrophosphohydrolase [Henriciella sp.]